MCAGQEVGRRSGQGRHTKGSGWAAWQRKQHQAAQAQEQAAARSQAVSTAESTARSSPPAAALKPSHPPPCPPTPAPSFFSKIATT